MAQQMVDPMDVYVCTISGLESTYFQVCSAFAFGGASSPLTFPLHKCAHSLGRLEVYGCLGLAPESAAYMLDTWATQDMWELVKAHHGYPTSYNSL